MKNWKVFIICLVIVFGVSFIGSLFTAGNVDSSLYQQNKPVFTPPDWIFGPVWVILYFLIALSIYFAWTKAKKGEKKKLAAIFGINLAANALWSYLFFELQNSLLAFIDIVVILITIIMIILFAGRIDKKSGWIIAPYLIWVAFASILNFSFVI
ncbi:tryptophan-rich sensory protein [Candidatus Pacearchaeota archaeon]|nr:tryptophan-rich sensory protein [Candidatus Pacearchaeota archaeon]